VEGTEKTEVNQKHCAIRTPRNSCVKHANILITNILTSDLIVIKLEKRILFKNRIAQTPSEERNCK